jgi:hypothetical protein
MMNRNGFISKLKVFLDNKIFISYFIFSKADSKTP